MPSTLAGQLSLIAVGIGILAAFVKAKNAYDKDRENKILHLEWLELMFLDYARKTGYPVSDALIKKHMKINGNTKKSNEEKDRIYGVDRPRENDSNGDLSTAKVKTIL